MGCDVMCLARLEGKKEDYTNLYTSCLTIFSGNWNNATNASVFQLNLNNTFTISNTNVSAHLLFPINTPYMC